MWENISGLDFLIIVVSVFITITRSQKKCSDVTFSEKTNNGKNFHLNQSLRIDLVLFRHLDSLVSFDSIREI